MSKRRNTAYDRAGVSLEAGEKTLNLIAAAVSSTYDERVLAGLGAFGGLFDASFLKAYRAPVLVASTDGVGTKTKVAAALGRWSTIGTDLVHHCINDILVQGAKPLFFLDYVASARLEPEVTARLVTGVAAACRATGTVLLGGETAEMPGVYVPGEFDLVGTVVGVVERDSLVTGAAIRAGDQVFALASGGLQTNGFSLARAVLADTYAETFEGATVGDALLTPHRHYLKPVRAIREKVEVKGMAHITGGGLPGNLPRVLPPGLGVRLSEGSWPVPPIFTLIQERGGVPHDEMFRAFNMGAGFVLVVSEDEAGALAEACPEPVYRVGVVAEGAGVTFTTSLS